MKPVHYDDLMKPVRYIVETGSADAIILNQIEPQDPRVAYLMERGFPFATHGRSIWADKHAYFDFDNGVFGRHAVDLLNANGRKSVAAVVPPLMQSYALHLADGLRTGAETNSQTLRLIEGATSDDSTAKIIEAVRAHLVKHPDTDAIVAASTTAAMSAVGALEAHDLTVGKEIDVLAKEAAPFLKLFRENIISMSESVGAAGDFLARAAIQAIREPELPPMQYLEVPVAP